MTVAQGPSAQNAARHQLRRYPFHLILFAAFWAILAGGEGWGIGAAVVLAASAASTAATRGARWSLSGIGRFVPYFIWNSVRGGIDVAWRALHPRLPIDPAIQHYPFSLQDKLGRVIMANVVTLLPGTLSADICEDELVVHVLTATPDVADRLRSLEGMIADLFTWDSVSERI